MPCSVEHLVFFQLADGPGVNATVFHKLCGSLSGNNYTVTANELYVKFYSDYTVSDAGFIAYYTVSAPSHVGEWRSNH